MPGVRVLTRVQTHRPCQIFISFRKRPVLGRASLFGPRRPLRTDKLAVPSNGAVCCPTSGHFQTPSVTSSAIRARAHFLFLGAQRVVCVVYRRSGPCPTQMSLDSALDHASTLKL